MFSAAPASFTTLTAASDNFSQTPMMTKARSTAYNTPRCCELKAGDLIVDRQSVEGDVVADQKRSKHRQQRSATDNYYAGKPDRLAGQIVQHQPSVSGAQPIRQGHLENRGPSRIPQIHSHRGHGTAAGTPYSGLWLRLAG